MVSSVSSSKWAWNDGSSLQSLAKASLSLLRFFLSSRLTFISMTAGGILMDSNKIGCSSSQSVSPVLVYFMPTRATISPALASLISSRSFALMRKMRPTRSLFSLLVL